MINGKEKFIYLLAKKKKNEGPFHTTLDFGKEESENPLSDMAASIQIDSSLQR